MLRKTDNQKGFTIIEVVITIAIGAAVMALALNAVAGARRSQRNNARASDVNQLASAVNQYIATRNALPSLISEISTIIDGGEKFGHYDLAASVNSAGSWDGGTNPVVGVIPILGSGGVALNNGSCSIAAGNAGSTVCTGLTPAGVWTAASAAVPAATGRGVGGDEPASADVVVIVQQAGCGGTDRFVDGGIREMAIMYRLEGQPTPLCLEI